MSERGRLHIEVRGAVQGVGFRPFVYRLAEELALAGWVRNDNRGVILEVEGAPPSIADFRRRLERERPEVAVVQEVESRWIPTRSERDFRIVASDGGQARSVVVLPDLATCPDCRREILDAGDRRAGYPFTNCTNCGPRFTIVRDLPYDRSLTTMRDFTMCPDCRREYEDPRDRRFHAQPDACPVCGPQVSLIDSGGGLLAERGEAITATAAALAAGSIVALKGIGGYQLLVDARDEAAVQRLRRRKRRPAKPLALLVRDLEAARALAEISPAEAALLESRQAPIVLLRRREEALLAPGVAPGHPLVGLMLPTTPLHHLLAAAVGFPLVATSGNLSDEPIAIDDEEARLRLGGIADLLLRHDRPIARHVDDSVAWIVEGAPQLLRRARGYAPLPVRVRDSGPTVLAVGAHQKDVVALAVGRQVFLSQHLGDMETPEARAAFERVIADFIRIYEAPPEAIAHDLHPDYPTSQWARRSGRPLVAVQHHHAHLAAALAEHGEPGEALGLTWDGTGYGADGTIWGGECLLGDARGFERVARLRPFRLPGGEAAVREPRRVALSLLWQVAGEAAFDELDRWLDAPFTGDERRSFGAMVGQGLNSPLTSSAGRLFDGIAALVGFPGRVSYEGEAAMRLEFAATGAGDAGAYLVPLIQAPAPSELAPGQRERALLWELDWRPLVAAALADRRAGASAGVIASRFHAALAGAALAVARRVGASRVALTGGCFQNRRLSAAVAGLLRADGREVLIHRLVPANDGGIALGQVAVARARMTHNRQE